MEDTPFWDETTEAILEDDVELEVEILAKREGVVAGVEEAAYILQRLGIEATILVKSGGRVSPTRAVMRWRGGAKKILEVERTILNLLVHCSGVATATRRLVDTASRAGDVKVAATRKTLPGLRYFEKKAVLAGGGDTHRMSLSDALLVKKDHVKIVGGLEEAVKRARRKAGFTRKVEVEVATPREAITAAKHADIIMLDNFTPEQVREAVRLLKVKGLRDKILIEVSGGVTAENVAEYAGLGVDVVSSGWITHSAPALDMSLEILRVGKKKPA